MQITQVAGLWQGLWGNADSARTQANNRAVCGTGTTMKEKYFHIKQSLSARDARHITLHVLWSGTSGGAIPSRE